MALPYNVPMPAVILEVAVEIPRLRRHLGRTSLLEQSEEERVVHAAAQVGAMGIRDRVPILTGQLLGSVELPRRSNRIFIRAPYASNVNVHSSRPRFIERMMSETVEEQEAAAEEELARITDRI